MQPAPFALIADLIEDPANGWSIGSFGTTGEFVRDPDEPAELRRGPDRVEVVTARGAMRVVDRRVHGVAWDSLSKDGESWGHALAFCLARPGTRGRVVRALGPDRDAIRAEDRGAALFDLGVGCGCVAMAARTADPALIAALTAAEGQPLLSVPGIMDAVLAGQPHRVLLSPAARIEVYQAIPPVDGKSPEGPHTHLLPRLIARDRPHSANVPIPEGWQAVLSMHPPSPWRTRESERHPFDPSIDAAFRPLLDRFGLAGDREVERHLLAGLENGGIGWPESRRGRHKARIVLRRLQAAGDPRVAAWRRRYDRVASDDADEMEEGDEA